MVLSASNILFEFSHFFKFTLYARKPVYGLFHTSQTNIFNINFVYEMGKISKPCGVRPSSYNFTYKIDLCHFITLAGNPQVDHLGNGDDFSLFSWVAKVTGKQVVDFQRYGVFLQSILTFFQSRRMGAVVRISYFFPVLFFPRQV